MGILKPNNLTGLPLQLGVFTQPGGSPVGQLGSPQSGLPDAARFTGGIIFVSDASNIGYGSPDQFGSPTGSPGTPFGSPLLEVGGIVCVSNGTEWINVVDGEAVT